MCNSRPGYRGGWALALQADGETVPANRIVSLNRDDAVALGREIIASEAEICDLFVERFIASFDTQIAEFDDRWDDARLDFAHGVIIDLRNMFFETEEFRHRVRLCITVCQHGKKSKIWFRTECSAVKLSGKWHAPIELSENDLARFFNEAEPMADCALSQLQDIYRDIVQSYVDCTVPGGEVELSLAEQFEFKVFDSDSERLPELFFDLKKGYSFTEWVGDRLLRNSKEAETALVAMNIAIPDNLPAIETLKSMRGDGSISIVDHASIEGDLGVFIKRSEPSTKRHVERVSFVGAAYDPSSREPDKKPGHSPAYRISAEMLARVTGHL